MNPITSADIGPTNPAAGVIATSPATAPEIAPNALGRPFLTHSARLQLIAAAAVAKCVAMKALVASELDASALPALNPNHPTHKTQRQTMRWHRLLRESRALSYIKSAHQRRHTRTDVNNGPTRKIKTRKLAAQRGVQQPALAPNHVSQRRIHDEVPQRQKQYRAAELHPFRRRACD